MEITEEQYERIKDALPVQRGNVRLSNLQVRSRRSRSAGGTGAHAGRLAVVDGSRLRG